MIVQLSTPASTTRPGTGTVGILPAVLVLAWGAIGGYLAKRANDRLLEVERLNQATGSPSPPPAAPAPQTAEQMTRPSAWTPEILSRTWYEQTQAAGPGLIPATPEMEAAGRQGDQLQTALMYGAIGLAAVSLFLIVRD